MSRPYTVSRGVFTFRDENYVLQLRDVQRNQLGRLFVLAEILTQDAEGYLGVDHGDLSSGRFRSGLATQAARRNSGDPSTFENLLLDALLAIRNDPDVTPLAPGPAFVSVEEFVRNVLPAGSSVVEGLLERGNLYGCASKPKVGKTILLLNLALAVATGRDWLGRCVTPGRVLFFQLEDSERTLKNRLELMKSKKWPTDLWLHARPFRLTEDNYNATLEACKGACLIICDPIIQASAIREGHVP